MKINKILMAFLAVNLSFFSFAETEEELSDYDKYENGLTRDQEKSFDEIVINEGESGELIFSALRNLDIGNDETIEKYEAVGDLINCGGWSPLPSEIRYEIEYSQERDCEIKMVLKDEYKNEKELEDFYYEEIKDSRKALGTKDYIYKIETKDWSGWVDKGDYTENTRTQIFIWASGKIEEGNAEIRRRSKTILTSKPE